MNTRQLYYLVTIADFGNLSHAAEALHVTQPALSSVLNEFESAFGFALFLRYRRQLMPTAVGRYVIDCAQKILDEQNRMLLTMRAVTGSRQATIHMATAPNRGAIIYSKIYNQFSRRYPDISLHLTELYASEQPGAIASGQIDLALGSGDTSDRVTDLPIAHEELLVSLPVSHPMAKQARIRLTDLRDTPFVLQGRRHSIRIIADKLFRQAGFSPVVAFESDDVILLDSMMHQAVGAGLVSQAHVFPCDELVYRPLDPPVYQTLHIRYPLGHTLTDPERYLASLLIRERLADPRYEAIHSPLADELYQVADTAEELIAARQPAAVAVGTSLPNARELNFDTKVLEYLIAIVEEQSLSRAAERFYLAQPALSRHLRNVERMVETPLFSREHNRLTPTNAGKVFVNNARNMLHIEAEMNAHIQAYRSGHSGGLHLCCDPMLLPLLEQAVAPAFARLYPDIRLRLEEADRETAQEGLFNASSDLGLYLSCQKECSMLHCQVLAVTELVYYLDPNTSPATLPDGWQDAPCLPEGLAGRPLMLAPAGSTLRAEQDRLLAGHFAVPPQVVCEARPAILQRLAAAGGADSILPLYLVEPRLRCRCFAFEPPQPFYLILARHVGRTLPACTRELCTLIAEACANVLALPHATRSPDKSHKEA